MSLNQMVPLRMHWDDANGAPLSGGKVYTYEPGTSTPKAAYQDIDGTAAHTNPITLDSRGEAEIWLSGSYKIAVYDSAGIPGTPIYTKDNVTGSSDVQSPVVATATATSGYWSKIATFQNTLGSSNLLSRDLLITTALGASRTDASTRIKVSISDTSGIGLDSAQSHISVLEASYLNLHDAFMLVGSASLGQPVQLWMRYDDSQGRACDVIKMSESEFDPSWSVSYNDGAAWQASAPSGAVTITSDWAGSGWITPTLINGYANAYSGSHPAQYRKLANGMVIFKGAIDLSGATSNTIAFTTIAGYRPVDQLYFGTTDANGGLNTYGIKVTNTGNVYLMWPTSSTGVGLSNVRYLAEN